MAKLINPADLAKNGREDGHQMALFCWASQQSMDTEIGQALKLMFAIPNGGQRGDGTKQGAMISGARFKAAGVKAGVPDIFWPVVRNRSNVGNPFHGLFIEMKKIGGHIDPDQYPWHDALRKQGFKVVTCWGWIAATWAIGDYWFSREEHRMEYKLNNYTQGCT